MIETLVVISCWQEHVTSGGGGGNSESERESEQARGPCGGHLHPPDSLSH